MGMHKRSRLAIGVIFTAMLLACLPEHDESAVSTTNEKVQNRGEEAEDRNNMPSHRS